MSITMEALGRQPIKIASTRVWRTYTGGMMIEEWQGMSDPKDSSYPEEWVASLVKAKNPDENMFFNEGLSMVDLEGAEKYTLKEIIEHNPQNCLGEKHIMKYGTSTGVLTKILDSAERLTIQVHPDRETAKTIFNSDYGKTEAWYVLGGREIDGEPPYVLFGFKPGMTRKRWKKMFLEQDIAGMLDALHKFYVKPGNVFLIVGGIPHAIGPGCFIVEIQEPTDLTLRTERTTPKGLKIPDELCHQGVGFDVMLDCFHYDSYTVEEVINRWGLKPLISNSGDWGRVQSLVSYKDTLVFAMDSIEIISSIELENSGSFSTLVVIFGEGNIRWNKRYLRIKQGEQVFLPAGVKSVICENISDTPMHLIRCFPPLS